jgi:hypothetical protein
MALRSRHTLDNRVHQHLWVAITIIPKDHFHAGAERKPQLTQATMRSEKSQVR